MPLKSPLIKFARAEKNAMANKRYKRCIPLPSLHLLEATQLAQLIHLSRVTYLILADGAAIWFSFLT
jgi:hypothetical protein